MRKMVFTVLSLLISCLMGHVCYAGQMDPIMVADIPFEFTLGKTTLPAGHYTLLGDSGHSFIWLRSEQNGVIAVTGTVRDWTGKVSESSSLTFHLVGGTYFLSKITMSGTANCRVLPKTARERELTSLAANPSTILIAGTPTAAK